MITRPATVAYLRSLLFMMVAALISACSSGPPKPNVDYKQDYNFIGVKKIGMYRNSGQVSGDNPLQLSDIQRERIDTALAYALGNRGFQMVDDPAEADVLLRTFRLLLYQNAYECVQEGKKASPLGLYYVNWYLKRMINRLTEIALDVYGGMGPQKELDLEHWIRVHLSLTHGGSTGTLNLIKAARVLAK